MNKRKSKRKKKAGTKSKKNYSPETKKKKKIKTRFSTLSKLSTLSNSMHNSINPFDNLGIDLKPDQNGKWIIYKDYYSGLEPSDFQIKNWLNKFGFDKKKHLIIVIGNNEDDVRVI